MASLTVTPLPQTVPTTPTMVPLPWTAARDADESCPADGCGHPYHRHFDWDAYGDWDDDEDMHIPVGCKYCECGAFAGLRVPRTPKPGTVGHLLTIVEDTGEPAGRAQVLTSVHATVTGARAALVAYVASNWDRDARELPEGTPHPSEDPDAAVDAFFTWLRTAYQVTPVTIQT